MERILVPVDGSEGANHAASFAARLARDSGAKVVLMHVFDAPTVSQLGLRNLGEEDLEKARAGLARGSFESARRAMETYGGVSEETHVALGHPAEEAVAHARRIGADVIVMGSRGLSQVQGILLGSVSEKVLRRAPCPVTIVR